MSDDNYVLPAVPDNNHVLLVRVAFEDPQTDVIGLPRIHAVGVLEYIDSLKSEIKRLREQNLQFSNEIIRLRDIKL